MKHDDNYIHVGPKWALQSDEQVVTLFKKRIVKKTGQLQYDAAGFFPNLEQALIRLVDMDIGPINHVEYIAKRQGELKQWIKEALKNPSLTGQDR